MASSFRLRRFSDAAFLRRIEHDRLVRFLAVYAASWPPLADLLAASALDIDRLAVLLASPDDGAPDGLLDALFFIDEVSERAVFADLLEDARHAGVPLGEVPALSPPDLALHVWMHDSEVIQRFHAERHLVRTRKFEHFPGTSPRPPRPLRAPEHAVAAMQNDLDDFFETRKKGRGTRVFAFEREHEAWFLVRHGEHLRREGTIENGESSSIFYRPEKYDIVVYDRGLGELAVHADTKGETREYCRVFGKCLFGDEAMFSTDVEARFALTPIVQRGAGCLVCSDVEGIEWVRLTELRWRHDSHMRHVEVHQSEDVFEALAGIGRPIPASATLLKAVFKMKFAIGERPRSVAIKPPNEAVFDRESDAPLVHDWLVRRRFTPRVLRVVGNVA